MKDVILYIQVFLVATVWWYLKQRGKFKVKDNEKQEDIVKPEYEIKKTGFSPWLCHLVTMSTCTISLGLNFFTGKVKI